jgi:hypothetical protein
VADAIEPDAQLQAEWRAWTLDERTQFLQGMAAQGFGPDGGTWNVESGYPPRLVRLNWAAPGNTVVAVSPGQVVDQSQDGRVAIVAPEAGEGAGGDRDLPFPPPPMPGPPDAPQGYRPNPLGLDFGVPGAPRALDLGLPAFSLPGGLLDRLRAALARLLDTLRSLSPNLRLLLLLALLGLLVAAFARGQEGEGGGRGGGGARGGRRPR